MPDIRQTQVLVIGAGAAGLEAAWAARRQGAQVLVLDKGANASCAILGFNAPVGGEDSPERFAQDMLRGGWWLGDRALVDTLAAGARETVEHLESLGLAFNRGEDGNYRLLKPLGCSTERLVCHKNITGRASMELLRKALAGDGVEILKDAMAVELVMQEGRAAGAAVMQGGRPLVVQADAVVLACGGGHVMKNSTYPLCQTADGYAMAYQAGAPLVDMEFVQFEPCRAVWPRPLGLSTTLLAKGGILTNRLGERFILKHYPSEGAVPKDMLARLIAVEICEGRGTEHGGVYLDLTRLPEAEIRVNHALYDDRFMRAGIDLTRDVVEVGPAAHSIMGGVWIDKNGFTGVPGLYAAGEVTGGLHGANRLGGNAGAEVYVFGRIAGQAAARERMPCKLHASVLQRAAQTLSWEESGAVEAQRQLERLEGLIAAAREQMSAAAGPVRRAAALTEAALALEAMARQIDRPMSAAAVRLCAEARHLTMTGGIICKAALAREESRGVHYRSDFPQLNDEKWKKHIVFHLKKDKAPPHRREAP